MKLHITAAIIGFLLDLCIGDPRWLPHPVCAIGTLVTRMETWTRRVFKADKRGELAAGACTTLGVLGITGLVSTGILYLAYRIHPIVYLAAEAVMCYQMLAAKSLKTESMKVYQKLKAQDLEGARSAVSMIVGRDTNELTDIGITKAAVETVAENTSDGVIAPLFYMVLGGALGGYLYKAVNTMDSMIGYKNEKYLYFGRTAAKLDDLCNLIPARLSALFMIAAAYLSGMDGSHAWKIYKRDRYHHKSPNSAQTEAVCAGALNIQLAGDASYFGILHKKPTIGDDGRPVEYEDTRRANRLMYGTAWLAVAVMAALLLFLP